MNLNTPGVTSTRAFDNLTADMSGQLDQFQQTILETERRRILTALKREWSFDDNDKLDAIIYGDDPEGEQ
jgi:hypothetical protein